MQQKLIRYSLLSTLLFLTLIFWVENTVFSSEPKCPIEGNWHFCPEYSDEFNGSTLDSTKWWDFNPSWNGRKPGFFSRDNVSVSKGTLKLQARSIRPDELTVERKVRGEDQFATSIVKSKTRIKYGYLEARCKSMKAAVCNAFWLYDPLDADKKYKPGNFSEEIDIFEVFGKVNHPADSRICFTTVHRFYTPYVESLVNGRKIKLENYAKKTKVDYDFWQDFHVYALHWTPEVMTWYLDGKPIHTRANDYYSTALHIMFDCEIMKDWVGLPNKSDLPSTFEIDYLRVWQIK